MAEGGAVPEITIEQLLAAQPYNPEIIPDLEAYVDKQVRNPRTANTRLVVWGEHAGMNASLMFRGVSPPCLKCILSPFRAFPCISPLPGPPRSPLEATTWMPTSRCCVSTRYARCFDCPNYQLISCMPDWPDWPARGDTSRGLSKGGMPLAPVVNRRSSLARTAAAV